MNSSQKLYIKIFLLVTSLLYLCFEIYYNGHLIDVVSAKDVSKEMLESLEELGHNISAVGISLLLIRFIFRFIEKTPYEFNNLVLSLLMVILMTTSFFTVKAGLVALMDKIVEYNKDKRYSSYYISIFKYGLINNYVGYETLISKEHLNNLSVNDRLILSNMFLLNMVDEKLIDRFIKDGQNHFADIYIAQYGDKEYQEAKATFDKQAEKIAKTYNIYIKKSKELNQKFLNVENNKAIDLEYKKFTDGLYSKYNNYEKEVIAYEKAIDPSNKIIDSYYNDLSDYFKYQNYTVAQNKYRNKMIANFGHTVEPKRWCNEYCPDKDAIRKVIEEEGYRKWMKNSGGVPPTLNQREFFKHPKVLQEVIRNLKAKGLNVSSNFNYSKASFVTAYNSNVNAEFEKAKLTFYREFKKTTGIDIVFGLTYKQFTDKFKPQFTKKYGKEFGIILCDLIADSRNKYFYNEFYRPYFIKENGKEYLFEKSDFEQNKNSKIGDDSIKYLYIPPFAITISLITGLLNIIFIIAILLSFLYSDDEKRILRTKVILYVFIILYPIFSMIQNNSLQPYPILEKVKENPNGVLYLNLLKWAMVYEEINYNYLYPIFKKETKND